MKKVTFICDRCGAEIMVDAQGSPDIHYTAGKDLCDSCFKVVEEWLAKQREAFDAFMERR